MKSRFQIIREGGYYRRMQQRGEALRRTGGVPSHGQHPVIELAGDCNDALLKGWKFIGKRAKQILLG